MRYKTQFHTINGGIDVYKVGDELLCLTDLYMCDGKTIAFKAGKRYKITYVESQKKLRLHDERGNKSHGVTGEYNGWLQHFTKQEKAEWLE